MTRLVRLDATAPARADPYLLAGPEPSGAVCMQCEQAHGVVYRIRRSHWARSVPLHQACAPLWFSPRAGQRLATTIDALTTRDTLLCAAAWRFYPGMSMTEQAHYLHVELSRYASGAWRRERSTEACPVRHANRLTAVLWEVLRTHDRVPAARSIRFTLAMSPYSLPASGGKGEPSASGDAP